jgi:GTPase SAR1 family protein
MPVTFGQVIIGPPGSGKTTYCNGMAQFLRGLGRKTCIVNIDPANDNVPYEADIDIADLIQLEEVMESLKLGPNGGLIYCMEFLEKNLCWLTERLDKVRDAYLLIDCPGQVELYTHNDALKNIIRSLEKLGVRLCAVNLVDSHYCSDPSKFISVCLTCVNTMLQIELPHINVLSKIDQVEKFGKLQFNIDFYTEVLDLHYLTDTLPDDPFTKKYKKLNEAITDLVQNYSLVNFVPLSVNSKERMFVVKNAIDRANGYCFGSEEERSLRQMTTSAFGQVDFEYAKTGDIREHFMDLDGEEASRENRKKPKVSLGNGLDDIDMEPGFQI